jgi:hypothetical protein
VWSPPSSTVVGPVVGVVQEVVETLLEIVDLGGAGDAPTNGPAPLPAPSPSPSPLLDLNLTDLPLL